MNTISKIKLTEGPDLNHLYQESLELLSSLITIPSFSGDEMLTADQIESFLKLHGINTFRKYNNILRSNQKIICYKEFQSQYNVETQPAFWEH